MVDYSYYFAALAGRNPPVILSEPQPGFYRSRDGEPVAFFPDPGGTAVLAGVVPSASGELRGVRVRKGKPVELSDLQILESWPFIASSVVPEADWRAVAAGGQWPDEAPGLGHNQPPEDAELSPTQRADKLDALAADWRERHPDRITTKAESDQAAHYVTELRRAAGDLDDESRREVAPFQSIIAGIKARFATRRQKLEAHSAALKVKIKEFLDDQRAADEAERKRQEAERAKREAAGKAVNAPPPVAAPKPLTRVGGRGKAVFERVRYSAKIVDYPKALAAVAETAEIRETVQRLADAAARGAMADKDRKPEFGQNAARKLLPGTELETERTI